MDFRRLKDSLDGELLTDETTRRLYATDATAYREIPIAVCFPKSEEDIGRLIRFAAENKTSLIPRTAGTSLAGQVVGGGIVVDVSRYFTRIIEVNAGEKWALVQPGIVRDDLNNHLKSFGLYFAPETSAAHRAMIGGISGNNSCGSNSVVYGSTREHLLEVEGFLSDASKVRFTSESKDAFLKRVNEVGGSLEQKVYAHIHRVLSDPANIAEIE